MKNLLTKPWLKPIPKWIVAVLFFAALVGFLDSFYLTLQRYMGFEISCTILEGCNQVSQSAYSAIFGIPLSLVGCIYYFLMLLCGIALFDGKRPAFLLVIVLLSGLGVASAAWLLYAQAFLIKAFCIYCLLSAVASLVLLATSFISYKVYAGFLNDRH
ncbi:MAG: vitamin K epoxide reductase family protein [Candidatus Wildermuthbacteria bacterium]|nr:vitamin K epoxide reductase family protein [Candidatus Wildermuthbacteria bacterium]